MTDRNTIEMTGVLRGMWLHEQFDETSVVNRLGYAFRVRGRFDLDDYERAAGDRVAAHPVLRSSVLVNDGEPQLQVHDELEVGVERVDILGWSDDRIARLMRQRAHAPYDLQRGPLVRFVAGRVSDDEHVILIAAHHLVADMWSLSVLGWELGEAYAAIGSGEREPLRATPRSTFAQHAAAERLLVAGAEGDAHHDYWRSQLRGFDTTPVLRTDRPRTLQRDHRGSTVSFELDGAESERLNDYSRECSTTPSNVMLAVYLTVLARNSGRNDLAVTTVRAGRSARNARVQGCFVQPIVLRAELDPAESFGSFLRRVDAIVADGFAHGDYPLQDLLQRQSVMRRDGLSPFTALGYSFQKTTRRLSRDVSAAAALGRAGVSAEVGGVRLETTGFVPEPSPSEIGLRVAEVGNGYVVSLQYMSSLFDRATAERLAGHIQTALRALLDGGDHAVGTLPMLTPAELDRLREFEAPSAPPADRTVDHMLARAISDRPHSVAVRFGAESLTYAELEARADRVADRLRARGVGARSMVGLAMPRSIGAVVAIVGVIRAGAAYVPLDLQQPEARMRSIVDGCGVRVAVMGRDQSARFADLAHVHVDARGDVLGDDPDDRSRDSVMPTDPAYVMSTSGSTGEPKHVVVEHRNLASLIQSLSQRLGVGPDDVVLGQASMAFDMSVPDVFVALAAGATLVLVDDESRIDAGRLRADMETAGATLMFATPTTCRRLLLDGWAGDPKLTLVSCGEVLDADLAAQLVPIIATLWNGYGPTENTVAATVHRVGIGGESPVPIGRALDNTGCAILDSAGMRVPDGVVGELYLTGHGVARGYLGRPDETARCFVEIQTVDGEPSVRAYRTGDLVSRRADGVLLYHGRVDDQFKLRGFRIEPADVEAAVNGHTAISGSAVAVRRTAGGDDRLVAFVVPAPGMDAPSTGELRAHLAALLPRYMIPTLVVPIDVVPSTIGGKVDRTALPDVSGPAVKSSPPVEEPEAGAEATVAAVWREVIGLAPIGRHDDFFDLGGHSLLATKIASRLRSQFGREVDVTTVFRHPTVAALAAAIPALPMTDERVGVAAANDGWAPLTYSQERMWFIHRMNPDDIAYNLAGAVRLRGPLDIDAFRAAIRVVVERHDSLRTVFEQVDGVAVQRVVAGAVPELEVVDLLHVDPAERHEIVPQMMAEMARRPFDLSEFPLVHFVLFVVDVDEHVLLLVQHHIVSDQWSAGILATEVSAAYSDLVRGHRHGIDPAPQLAEFARRHRSEVESVLVDRHLAYWTDRLAGLEPVDLPTDRPRPARRSGRGASIEAEIPAELVSAIAQLCRREGVTPFMVTLAVFQILISRYTGARDVAVGTAVANRHRLDSERIIGSLVNSLVMRADVDEAVSFRRFLREVATSSLEAFAHQDMPFARLVAEMGGDRDPSRSPLFQVFFNVQNAPFSRPALDGVEVEPIHLERSAAQFDLSLSIDTNEQRAVLEYDVELFDRRRMEHLLDHYWTLLGALLHAPDRPVVDAPMLTADEIDAATAWQRSDNGYEAWSLHTLLEAMACERPSAPAITFGGQTLDAGTLNTRANRLARALRASGAGRGELVGVMLDRSIDMVVSVLAVLKSGAAYVPLDPLFPEERLRFVIEQSGLGLVVSDGRGLPLDQYEARVVDVSSIDLDAGDGTNLGIDVDINDRAYVIYTSGSTGRPKGVEITHGNVVNFVLSMLERPGIHAHDSVLASTTLSFDISVLEIFATLAAGARMVLIDQQDQMDPHALARHLDEVTVAQGTPTMWKMLVDAGWPGRPDLTVLCGGEAMPQSLADRLTATCGSVWNMYGPTETTVWSSACELRAGEAISLGEPVANTFLLVLDRHRRPVVDGVPGELWIGGVGVARGYLGRPDLTDERFVDDPFSTAEAAKIYRTGDIVRRCVEGRLRYVGRADQQIKLRGHRIELGEIETVLSDHPEVADAVVSPWSFGPDDQRLVAYYRLVSDPELRESDELHEALRSRAARALPAYMVPAVYVAVESFPITPNNKIDRSQLPDPDDIRLDRNRLTIAPHAGLETEIAEIWSDVLGVDRIGRHDNFFQLGGHSLLAVRAFARLDRLLAREVPLTTLFEHPTLSGFAAAVADDSTGGLRLTSVVAINEGGRRQPFFYVSPFLITLLSFADLSEHLGVEQPFYGIQPQGLDSGDAIHDTVEEMAQHYVAEMRTVQPDGPYLIGGHCSGSWVAFEMARQLQAVGERVDLLMLVDFGPPQHRARRVNPLRYVIQRLNFYRADGRLLHAVAWQLGLAKERFIVRRLGGPRAKRAAEVRARHAAAHGRYEPTRIDGGAVLVRTAESVKLRDRDWHLGWRMLLSGPLRVETVGGTHAGLVEDASSAELAAAIRRAIDDVEKVNGDSGTRFGESA